MFGSSQCDNHYRTVMSARHHIGVSTSDIYHLPVSTRDYPILSQLSLSKENSKMGENVGTLFSLLCVAFKA